MRTFSSADLWRHYLGWLLLLLSLRLIAWVDPEPMVFQLYDSIFCLALISSLWARNQPRLRRERL